MSLIMIIAALLPAIVIMIYIYKKDKVEREPKRLIFRLFITGALSIIPACILEILGERVLFTFLPETNLLAVFLDNFIIIALTEEFCKQVVIKKIAWNHLAFNYRFDAVVYGVSSALGFAALENVVYVMEGGLSVALTRAVLSIPLHAFCGVFMGLYLGQAKACEICNNIEGKKANLGKSIWIPVALHGYYDFCLSIDSTILFIAFICFVIVLYIVSIHKIKCAAAEDCSLSANWNTPFHQVY